MIEIVLSRKEHIQFAAEARKRMRMNGWNMRDLAQRINRPVGSVRSFFSLNNRPSRFIAAEIATVLEMEQKDWK